MMTYEQQEKGRAERAKQAARGMTTSALVSAIAHPTSGDNHLYWAACEELDRRIPPRGSGQVAAVNDPSLPMGTADVIEDDGYEEDAEARYERAHDPGGEDPYVTQAKRDAVRRVLELVERARTAPGEATTDLYDKLVDALEIGDDP